MPIITSKIDQNSNSFKQNQAYMANLVAELNTKANMVLQGGGQKAQQNHINKNKLLPRERIAKLLDPNPNYPFLELSQLAAIDMYDGTIASGGIITGIGRIVNTECMIIANDPTVKGGSYHPITIKKHLRAQQSALENNLPCVYLVDSGGANLPYQDEDIHCRLSGVADHLAVNEQHALLIARDIVANLNRSKFKPTEHALNIQQIQPPLYPATDLYGIMPTDSRVSIDCREIIARIVDGSNFHEF